jgi:hypothetical protein
VWKYARISVLVLIAAWGLALLFCLAARSVMFLYLIAASPYLLALYLPCFFWALLCGLAEPAQIGQSSQLADPAPHSSWLLVPGGLVPQAAAFLAALLATAPVSLGVRGVGCRIVYTSSAAEYWLWQGYKGIASQSESRDGIVLRPSVDSTVCMLLPEKDLTSLHDPKHVTQGYAQAARSWFWLLEPDHWDSPRATQIRQKLKSMLGRDFSSYQELQEWWSTNGEDLVWSGRDELLEVHAPSIEELVQTYPNRTDHPTVPTAVERIREAPYLIDSGEELRGTDRDSNVFRAALFDREARLRGLKLAAGDWIDVVTGERERVARESLGRLFGTERSTRAEWESVLDVNRSRVPWRMSRFEARQWVALIHRYGGNDPYRTRYVKALREQTGLNHSTPEEFIPWLETPENTRGDEWLKARDHVNALPDEQNRDNTTSRAMTRLTGITDRAFDSPEAWAIWWRVHRSTLTLSEDGRRLVTGRN